ncbi:uncharacterized protein PAE49_000252 [Odontesthes bonariensis]|uniref:uncharacterized protein LOC142373088 n=1 Tax=Odontesthes bonariensis TaxID=219752 RepID=UPI003F580493
MEAPPFSFTPERYWTEEKERALIAYFSRHSCLWNHKSESYKNRQLRWKTLERLRILLSSHPPPVPFTVEDIKNKFKNLRTTFQRQYKMVTASRGLSSEDVFVPQWKHFQQLMFLQGSWDQDDDDADQPQLSPQEESPPVFTSPGLIISFLPTPSTSSNSTSSSCVPSNVIVKSYWTEERERALISFYSEHSCLWKKKSENHNNRQLRQRLLESLRSQLSDSSVSFSVEDVKCKFKNLRTVFNREFKAVQAGKASDKHYASKWKHYQQLLFLCESCDEDDPPDDLHILVAPEGKDVELEDRTASSDLSSFSSSSPQTNSIKLSNTCALSSSGHCDANTDASQYHIFLSTTPDNLRLASQAAAPALPASPSRSLPDRKPCGSASLLNVSASGSHQPDGRLTAESRCLWSEAKVQQLIAFYSEHGCLWNHRSENYRNRLLRQSLLETLSGVLSENEPAAFTVEDVKTKFRNLRTIFQREHKAVSANRTCGSEDFYLPKWKHYHELMFLCDSCDEDEPPKELRFHGAPEFDASLRYCAAKHSGAALSITTQEAPPSPTPPDSRHSSPSSSPSTASSHTDSGASSGRKRSSQPVTAAAAGDLLELMRAVCQNQAAAAAAPHAGFLKYVEECLNETPPDKVKKLKKKIIETLHSAAEDV